MPNQRSWSIRALRILLDILLAWSLWLVAARQIALPECSDLVFLECAHYRMQYSPIMEEAQVSLLPVMRVDVFRRDRRALHLVQQVTDGAEVRDGSSIRVESSGAVAGEGSREGSDDECLSAARVNLQVQLSCLGVLPQLEDRMEDWSILDELTMCLMRIRTTGKVLTSPSVQAGSSSLSSSSPSFSIPSPVDFAFADDIQT